MQICPKCNYQRTDKDSTIPDYECPKCGVIYSKIKKETSSKIQERLEEIFETEKDPPPNKTSEATLSNEQIPTSNLINCLDCGKQISKRAMSCPHCGAPSLPTNDVPKKVEIEARTSIEKNQRSKKGGGQKQKEPEKLGCFGCLIFFVIIFIFSIILMSIFHSCSDDSDDTNPLLSNMCEKQCASNHQVGTQDYNNCVNACNMGSGEGHKALKNKLGIK